MDTTTRPSVRQLADTAGAKDSMPFFHIDAVLLHIDSRAVSGRWYETSLLSPSKHIEGAASGALPVILANTAQLLCGAGTWQGRENCTRHTTAQQASCKIAVMADNLSFSSTIISCAAATKLPCVLLKHSRTPAATWSRRDYACPPVHLTVIRMTAFWLWSAFIQVQYALNLPEQQRLQPEYLLR